MDGISQMAIARQLGKTWQVQKSAHSPIQTTKLHKCLGIGRWCGVDSLWQWLFYSWNRVCRSRAKWNIIMSTWNQILVQQRIYGHHLPVPTLNLLSNHSCSLSITHSIVWWHSELCVGPNSSIRHSIDGILWISNGRYFSKCHYYNVVTLIGIIGASMGFIRSNKEFWTRPWRINFHYNYTNDKWQIITNTRNTRDALLLSHLLKELLQGPTEQFIRGAPFHLLNGVS